MKFRTYILLVMLVMFGISHFIIGNTNYQYWIVLLLLLIAVNTTNKYKE